MPTVKCWKQRAHRDSYLNAEAVFSFVCTQWSRLQCWNVNVIWSTSLCIFSWTRVSMYVTICNNRKLIARVAMSVKWLAGAGVKILAKTGILFSLSDLNNFGAQPQPPIQWVLLGLFFRLQYLECGPIHSGESSFSVYNEWNFTYMPPLHCHGVVWEHNY